MLKNNKKRLLVLLKILRKESNIDKHLSINDLIAFLNKEGILVNDRKTLYDDLKILNEEGFDIEYDNGYFLSEAPFSLSEIKIIQDSINSLKNLDSKFLEQLSKKLYAFISNDEEKFLESIKYLNKHANKKLLQQMEMILEAIKSHKSVEVKRSNNQIEEVFPLFIHRENDYYYFYYHYPNSEKLYHYRFDNVESINFLKNIDEVTITRKKIIDTINASSNSYFKGSMQSVGITVLENNEILNKRIEDDFKDFIKTKNGYSIKVNVNPLFFSKLLAYGDKIKISDENIAEEYLNFLDSVKTIYQKKN